MQSNPRYQCQNGQQYGQVERFLPGELGLYWVRVDELHGIASNSMRDFSASDLPSTSRM